MAMIYITCPDCTAHTPMPAPAMLATLDLGEVLGPLGQLSLGLPQDILTLHELLETEAWVQQRAERPGGCS
jgi:hypothetical protein